jgi:N-acetylmuramoyl-L-alanine amidase
MNKLQSTVFASLIALTACSTVQPAPRAPSPQPQPVSSPTTGRVAGLPEIPPADGALAIDLVYPRENTPLGGIDSTFIFGNVGSGRAQLRINGALVQVEQNGSFLAFLPVPGDGVYRAEATRNGETARAERRVVVPAAEAPSTPSTRTIILANSIAPRGTLALRRGEPVEVTFRGTAGGTATLVLPSGRRIALSEQRREGTNISTYRASIDATPLVTRDTAVRRPRVGSLEVERETQAATAAAAAARGDTVRTTAADPFAHIELIVGTDTARVPLPASISVIDPLRPAVGVANDPNPAGGDNDGYVVGRPTAGGGVSHYFWPNGTELAIVGERGNEYRVRLNDDLTAWVNAAEIRLLPTTTSAPASNVNNVSITTDIGWIDIRFPVARRLPFFVEEQDRALVLTLYGGTSASDWLIYGARDTLIEHAWWDQPEDDAYRFTIRLKKPVWGYQTFWNERGHLILRVRRPPSIDRASPLRGRLIALDPGHGPPEGRWGPTRLTESAANLAIAVKLRELLERAGARVLMTRTDTSAVGLYDRPLMALRANADLFVSIHNNAVGDGTNPYLNHGTSTYFFHANSEDLARKIQTELVNDFRLPDLGYVRASLAVVRWPTWMPAVLTESMFFIMPQQEAALRDPAVIERIAQAHLRGIEAFLRDRQ